MHSLLLRTCLGAALCAPVLCARSAHANDARKPRFSLALERAGGLSGLFLAAEDDDGQIKARVRSFALAGPVTDPLSAPRLAFDRLLPGGLTFGVAAAFGFYDVVSIEGGDRADEGGLGLLMLHPRIGYRVPLFKRLDLTPRIGAALGWAQLTDGGQTSCTSSYDAATDSRSSRCKTDNNSLRLLAAVVDVEVVAALRATDSFNLLLGLSYNLVVAASVKEQQVDSGDADPERIRDSHLSSLGLWLGLGGYL